MNIMYSTFQTKSIFEEVHEGKKQAIKAQAIDYKKKMLILMYKGDKSSIVKRSLFKFIDLENMKTVFQI